MKVVKYEWKQTKLKAVQALEDIMKKIIEVRQVVSRGDINSALDKLSMLMHKYSAKL